MASTSSGQSHTQTSLDAVFSEITHSTDDESLVRYLKHLANGSRETQDLIFASMLSDNHDPLDILSDEITRYTIGMLYILSARLSLPHVARPSQYVLETFCARFDPARARLAPERMTMLARGIFNAYGGNAERSVPPLTSLVTRYPPSLSYLTTIHPIFLRVCVGTRSFDAALPVLTEPVTEIDTSLSDLHYNDNLLYHYAGGMVFAALKRWVEAEEFFEIVVGSPAQVPAAIQLEALKKLALVQLIAYGKLRDLPKYASPALTRPFKNSVYGAFINSYPLHTSELERLLEKEAITFEADRNVGLVKQAIQRSRGWSIKKLTETYISLSLPEIGEQIGVLGLDAVRSIVLTMIDEGEIDGSISADGIVTFNDSVPSISKAQVEAMLGAAQEEALLLAELDRKMGRSREFLNKAVKSRDDGWGANEDEFVRLEKGDNWGEESLFS